MQDIFSVKTFTSAFHLDLAGYICATGEVVIWPNYNLKLRLLTSKYAEINTPLPHLPQMN